MKRSMQIFILIIFALLVVLPLTAFSDVKILLKNGRSIIADTCREANGKLICEKMGGTFEFEKNDIAEIKEITVEKQYPTDTQTLISEPEPKGKQEEIKKPASDAKDSAKPDEGALIKGLSPEATKRLDEITKRKIDLKTDRDNLIKEREQLREDIKSAGVMHRGEKLNALQKRINDLDEKINRFNDEVNKLNEEENNIFKESEKTK